MREPDPLSWTCADHEQAQGRLHRQPVNLLAGSPVTVRFISNGIEPKEPMTPLRLAGIFQDTYEWLAPGFGYETRSETREFRPASPNGQLMIAVCKEILTRLECDHSEVAMILADVSPGQRAEIGRLVGIDYNLGPGSGKQIPLALCLKCGKVQYKPQSEPT